MSRTMHSYSGIGGDTLRRQIAGCRERQAVLREEIARLLRAGVMNGPAQWIDGLQALNQEIEGLQAQEADGLRAKITVLAAGLSDTLQHIFVRDAAILELDAAIAPREVMLREGEAWEKGAAP